MNVLGFSNIDHCKPLQRLATRTATTRGAARIQTGSASALAQPGNRARHAPVVTHQAAITRLTRRVGASAPSAGDSRHGRTRSHCLRSARRPRT